MDPSLDCRDYVAESAKITECLITAQVMLKGLSPPVIYPRVDNTWSPPRNPCTIDFANSARVGPKILSICASLYWNNAEGAFELEMYDRSFASSGQIRLTPHQLEGWSGSAFGSRRFPDARAVAIELAEIHRLLHLCRQAREKGR